MKVKLTRIAKYGKSGPLRGDEAAGYAARPPIVGERFTVWSDNADGTTRHVSTSNVTAILPDGEFLTESGSLYKIELGS